MRSIRKVLLVSGIIMVIGLGFVFYQMFLGPDHIEFAGKSLQQLFEEGDLIGVLVIPIVLIISAVFMIPFLRIIFPANIKDGITTRARVIKVRDTGVTINDNPQVGLLLEFSPIGSGPVQIEARTVVSRLNAALVQPGITAEIKYDPKKTTRIQILTLNIEEEHAPTDTAARLEELNELHTKNLITEEEYQQKRAEILKNL
jgi:hypothetical protein